MPEQEKMILGLSGELLPIHLKPQPDELLSSWLIRLAHAHGLKLQNFCAMIFGRDKNIWNRDIDKLAPDWLITKLAECTGTSKEDVFNTTLKSYEGILYESHNPNGNTKWILPLGVYHRNRHAHGLLYCPQCLAEDVEPYFRKQWRLAFSVTCTKHRCHLLDGCPQCASPASPHRVDMQGRSYHPHEALNASCWNCSFDLRLAKADVVTNEGLISIQRQLESAMKNRYLSWASNHSMYSMVFFEGIRNLIAGLITKESQRRIRFENALSKMALSDWTAREVEKASLPNRYELLKLLNSVMADWPANFIELIHRCKLRYSDLKGDSTERMYWYENVIRFESTGGYSEISQEEADSIANYVEAKDGCFSSSQARYISGRDIHSRTFDRQPQSISDDIYEDLMTNIDHQIAGTFNKTKRACLIRDKVMFAAGRILGLSEGALAKLTLEQLRAVVADKVDVNFSDVARTPAQVRAWVEWYWNFMRPALKPNAEVNCVFTSARTHRGFGHSSVGLNFQKAVNTGMMIGTIKGYSSWLKH